MAASISGKNDRDWYLNTGDGSCPPAAEGISVDLKMASGEEVLNGRPGLQFWNLKAITAWRPAIYEELPDNFFELLEAGAPALSLATVDISDYEQTGFVSLPLTGPYGELGRTLAAAFAQASEGKGKERHAVGGVAFHEQPMATINRQLGSIDGFIYQAHKKSLEAKRLPADRAQAELLGAINYLAGAAIALDTWASKPAA